MRQHSRKAMTLVEIMIVLAIIGIIVAIAAPTWYRQRETARGRACQENLSKIDEAKELYAMEFRLSNGSTINYPSDLIQPDGVDQGKGYLRKEPICPASGIYTPYAIGEEPECSIGSTNVPFEPHIIPK